MNADKWYINQQISELKKEKEGLELNIHRLNKEIANLIQDKNQELILELEFVKAAYLKRKEFVIERLELLIWLHD